MREQREFVLYAEPQGGNATSWINLLSVNEHFEGKPTTKEHLSLPLFLKSALYSTERLCAVTAQAGPVKQKPCSLKWPMQSHCGMRPLPSLSEAPP